MYIINFIEEKYFSDGCNLHFSLFLLWGHANEYPWGIY